MSNLINKIIKCHTRVFALVFLVLIGLFCYGKADAATVTATVTGNWSDTATWGGSSVPTSLDDVIINDGVNVNVDTSAQALSLVLNAPNVSNGITISGTNSLTVSGDINMNSPTSVVDQIINVGDGTLSMVSINMPGGSTAGYRVILRVHNGTINASGDINFTGTSSQTIFESIGDSNLNIEGLLGFVGTLITSGTGTIKFTGTVNHNMARYLTYNNVIIDKLNSNLGLVVSATVIGGTLTVERGTFNIGSAPFTVQGISTIKNEAMLKLTSIAGIKTFNGDVVINEGGIWEESAAVRVVYEENLTNNGTFTSSTQTHTFTGNNKLINGVLSFDNLVFSSMTTNNGTLTALSFLSGAGTLTNASTGILNIGGTSTVIGLNATAHGNKVVYTAGGQTIKEVQYDLLELSGSGTDTLGSGITIANDFVIGSGINLNLIGNSTSYSLSLGGLFQESGTWGATGSGATHINDTYFSGTGTINVAHGYSSSNLPIVSTSHGSHSSQLVTTCFTGELFSSDTGYRCTSWIEKPIPPTVIISNNNIGPDLGLIALKKGSKGLFVKNLQGWINKNNVTQITVDGIFGNWTESRILVWQKSVGLYIDGVVGKASREKIATSFL